MLGDFGTITVLIIYLLFVSPQTHRRAAYFCFKKRKKGGKEPLTKEKTTHPLTNTTPHMHTPKEHYKNQIGLELG